MEFYPYKKGRRGWGAEQVLAKLKGGGGDRGTTSFHSGQNLSILCETKMSS